MTLLYIEDPIIHERLRRSTIIMIVILAMLAISPLGGSPPAPSGEPGPLTLHISVVRYLESNRGTETGGLRRAFDAPGPWYANEPELVVADDRGQVVATMEITQGTLSRSDEGVWCTVRAVVPLPDAPFFTFMVADVYTRTVSQSALAAAGWSYEIKTSQP